MHFEPTAFEAEALQTMTGPALMEYFVTRTAEVEEVWGLGNLSGWVMRELDGETTLPVWPYRLQAGACSTGEWDDQCVRSVSLEHFIQNILNLLVKNDIKVEIMPTENSLGYIMDPQQLLTLYESVMESGSYYLEG